MFIFFREKFEVLRRYEEQEGKFEVFIDTILDLSEVRVFHRMTTSKRSSYGYIKATDESGGCEQREDS